MAPPIIGINEARDLARGILQRVRSGLPAVEPKAESFGVVAAAWLKRHVEKNALRSAHEIERLLDRHVLPVWRDRELTSLRRSDVAALLDSIEDGVSPRQADAVLTVIRSLMNWYATRNDGFIPPITRGMRRQSLHAQQRSRVLSDDELRAIWLAAEGAGAFGAAVRLCLLTAQRRAKVLRMRWADIDDTGTWTIPREAREKDTPARSNCPRRHSPLSARSRALSETPMCWPAASARSTAYRNSRRGSMRKPASPAGGFTICDARHGR